MRRSVSASEARLFALMLGLVAAPALRAQAADSVRWMIEGTVVDSGSARPIPGVLVVLTRARRTVAQRTTDEHGAFELGGLAAATYRVETRQLGYAVAVRTVTLARGHPKEIVTLRLHAVPTSLKAVRVTAGVPMAVDVRTGEQSYIQRAVPLPPSTTTSQILQLSAAGAARAPTGEVHVRGQHAEYTYYVDGVPVPSGISGSLNEVLDPAVAARVDVQTGGWDAEYGNKNIAVVKIETRVPDAARHWEGSADAGSFGNRGATLLASSANESAGALLSVTHRATAMRREPVVADPRTGAPVNFHNGGTDDYAFGKVEWHPSARDLLEVTAGASVTRFAVPFDSAFGLLDDHQHDANSFLNASWTRSGRVPPAWRGQPRAGQPRLLVAAYLRRSSLGYEPGAGDAPAFVFYPDTTVRYSVRERRASNTGGVRVVWSAPLTASLAVAGGVEGSLVTGREVFETCDALGRSGPGVQSGLRGGDAGGFAQLVWWPAAQWELRSGVRLDHHVAPLAGDQHQVSPRVRLAYFPDASTSLWFYYGRLFIPSNVEDFHVLASAAQGGTVGLPTIPERDHYIEVGATRRAGALTAKVAGYDRNDSPAVDDNTLPGTALTTTVDIAHVHVTGLETALAVDPGGAWSAYLNAALSHARGHGPITGGFFPTAYPTGWFDQDHDQRLSIVGAVNVGSRASWANVTGIFGSGLTNGHPDAAPNKAGLLDFNPAVKVAPTFIVDAGAGTRFAAAGMLLSPSLHVENALDRHYVLKGAFTSGPSIGRPRTIEVRMKAEGGSR